MSWYRELEPAAEQELNRRRASLTAVGQQFLRAHVEACVFIVVGTALKAAYPHDTDIIVAANGGFTMTPDEVDRELRLPLRDAELPPPDTFEVIKIVPNEAKDNEALIRHIQLPEPSPFGALYITRDQTMYKEPQSALPDVR